MHGDDCWFFLYRRFLSFRRELRERLVQLRFEPSRKYDQIRDQRRGRRGPVSRRVLSPENFPDFLAFDFDPLVYLQPLTQFLLVR